MTEPTTIGERQAIAEIGAQTYSLALIAEECAEATQLVGKALRFGYDTPGAPESPFNGETARTNLPKELGDIRAAIRFASAHGLVDEAEVKRHEDAKFAKLTNPESRDNLGRPLAPLPTPTTNAPVAETTPDKLREMLLAVEDFINEPQRNRDIEPMEVRDYRHELYRKWSPLCQAILALRQALPIHGEMREALEPFALISSEGIVKVESGYVTITTRAEYFHRARNALNSNTGSSS